MKLHSQLCLLVSILRDSPGGLRPFTAPLECQKTKTTLHGRATLPKPTLPDFCAICAGAINSANAIRIADQIYWQKHLSERSQSALAAPEIECNVTSNQRLRREKPTKFHRSVSIRARPSSLWLFGCVSDLSNGLHILQSKFYWNKQPQRSAMFHGERLTVEVGRK